MNEKPSDNVEPSECSGSDVTTIETVTVCTIDRRKAGDLNPKCTTRVRVLNNNPGSLEMKPSQENETIIPQKEDDQTASGGAKKGQMCVLPSRKMTHKEEEAATINCMEKSQVKNDMKTMANNNLVGRKMRRKFKEGNAP